MHMIVLMLACDPLDIGAFRPMEDIWAPLCAAVPIGLKFMFGCPPRFKPDEVPGMAPKSIL